MVNRQIIVYPGFLACVQREVNLQIIVHPGFLACVQMEVNRQIIVHFGFLACVQREVNRQIVHSGFLTSVNRGMLTDKLLYSLGE